LFFPASSICKIAFGACKCKCIWRWM
jgi:hypothetical protein